MVIKKKPSKKKSEKKPSKKKSEKKDKRGWGLSYGY